MKVAVTRGVAVIRVGLGKDAHPDMVIIKKVNEIMACLIFSNLRYIRTYLPPPITPQLVESDIFNSPSRTLILEDRLLPFTPSLWKTLIKFCKGFSYYN